MPTRRHVLTLAAALAACAPATAQAPGGAGAGQAVPGPNLYEVAPEHAESLAALHQDATDAGFLEVTGTGRVSVPADRARVVFAVETEGGTAAEASTLNADLMTAVLAAVRSANGPGLSLETHGYTLSPEYARPSTGERGPVISGYRAMNNVSATVADLDAVGRVIDAAIGAGANRVASLVFEASETGNARAEALRLAVRQATAEATAMAEALGVRLGAPLEVRGGANVPGPNRFMAARVQMAAETPVEAGQQAVVASVTIKYRLGG